MPIQAPRFFTDPGFFFGVEIGTKPQKQLESLWGIHKNNNIWEMFLQVTVSYYAFEKYFCKFLLVTTIYLLSIPLFLDHSPATCDLLWTSFGGCNIGTPLGIFLLYLVH